MLPTQRSRPTWNVVYDARGHLKEPYTGREIGLGTLAARKYQRGWQEDVGDPDAVNTRIREAYTNTDPMNLYSAVLFIEKEGFDSLIEATQLRERYGIATMSTKGMPVTACRELVDRFTAKGIPAFVLRDFDLAGFRIVYTLTHDNRRHTFEQKPLVYDIGLRLEKAHELGIVDTMKEAYKITGQNKDPAINLRECGATEDEIEFLVQENVGQIWAGERIELNALSAGDFIALIETALDHHGITKPVPDEDTLAAVWQQNSVRRKIEELIKDTLKNADIAPDAAPDGLRDQIAAEIVDNEN